MPWTELEKLWGVYKGCFRQGLGTANSRRLDAQWETGQVKAATCQLQEGASGRRARCEWGRLCTQAAMEGNRDFRQKEAGE